MASTRDARESGRAQSQKKTPRAKRATGRNQGNGARAKHPTGNEPGAPAYGRRVGLPELRRICLGLPEVREVEAWGDPTFRVRDKIFAMHKIGDGRPSLWCKAPDGAQAMLVEAASDRVYVPPYVGHRGWIGIRLDVPLDWAEVAYHVRTSYALIAPRTLARTLEPSNPGSTGAARRGRKSARTPR